MKILVVDNEWQVLKAIGLMLEFSGLSPSLALGAGRGLEEIKAGSFDLILCDVQMPGMSGPEFFQAVRLMELPVFPRFVFMSGTATESFLMAELGVEKVKLLPKPFNLQALKAALQVDEEEGAGS
jgi:CheY-like chemotaxis protein